MKIKKVSFLFCLLFCVYCTLLYSIPLYSPAWGFSLDLPEDYEFIEGNGLDRYSFENPEGARFDLRIYHAEAASTAPYANLEDLVLDVEERLNNMGSITFFTYRQKEVWIIELIFQLQGPGTSPVNMSGWALAMELESANPGAMVPMLLAMAYGPAEDQDLQILHLSTLDSLAPARSDTLAPGPITEFAYPRERAVTRRVFGTDIYASFFMEDAEAAQSLIEREFKILIPFADSPFWREAWMRYYRAIYRDSYERLADTALQMERKLNVSGDELLFAQNVLNWVQSFNYERDLTSSDFINLVDAAIEGRGDCDSRAMLWALVLNKANIASGIMVSPHYGHAMGLADIEGEGARFEVNNQSLLVAETTAPIPIGLIEQTVSDPQYWLGIMFD